MTKRLRSFLRLVSYYRKFVQDFAKIAKPLSDLLKKSVSEIWDEHCYRAFGELKRHLTCAPVLKFLEFKKPFEMHTDASDFAIGGVLMQEGRPVAFESKKGGPWHSKARSFRTLKGNGRLMRKRCGR